MDIPEIKKVEKIDVQNGDVLAVFIKGRVNMAELEMIKKKLENDFLPKAVKVEIFNADIVELKVLRAE